MRRPCALLAALAVVVLASGCGEDTVSTAGSAPSPGARTPAPGEPVLQVEQTGGFRPADAAFASMPELTVLADGRAFTLGPQLAIYPGPLLPNVRVHQLQPEQLTELQALAQDAGLLAAPPDYGSTLVSDATTTVVRLRVDGAAYEHRVYALDRAAGPPVEDAEPPAPTSPGPDDELRPLPEGGPGLSPEAQQARHRVSAFLDAVRGVVETAGPGEAYVPEALAVRSAPAVDDGPQGPVEPAVRPWPLPGLDLTAAGECLVLAGTEASTLLPALQEANALTRFEQAGERFTVAVRPLLPGQEDC